MKNSIAIFIFLFCVSTAFQAQNYQISFSGSGASVDVDSVKVENLTKCTSINIGGSDVLHLVAQVGINEIPEESDYAVLVYPNPAAGYCNAQIILTENDEVAIGIYDITGKQITILNELLLNGRHNFLIDGLNEGIYFLKVESKTFNCSSKIVCISPGTGCPEIKHVDASENSDIIENTMDLKNEKSLISMQYSTGDLLKLTGKSGIYRTVYMLVPVSDQNVSFTFIPCTDANGNSYSVVQIGEQWWMAENLNAGTYVPVTTPQVSGTKFCMDVNGQADPDCPMGGLYEFANLLQGSSPCNGSGAPPNDECSTPIKGLCPNGWHIPSHYEWTTLEKNSGSNPSAFPYDNSTISLLGTDEGGNLKEACSTNWWDPNAGATNLTGFSALPGGDTWNGVFEDFGQSAYFWTSSETLFMAWVHALNYSLTVVGRANYAEESGFSCRCVKD